MLTPWLVLTLFVIAGQPTRPASGPTFEQLASAAGVPPISALVELATTASDACTCGDEFATQDCRQTALATSKQLNGMRGRRVLVELPAAAARLGTYNFQTRAFPISVTGPFEEAVVALPEGCGARPLCRDPTESEQVGFIFEADLSDRVIVGDGASWRGALPVAADEAREMRNQENPLRVEVVLQVEGFAIRATPNPIAERRKVALVEAMTRKLASIPSSYRSQYQPRLLCMKQIDTSERTASLRMSVVGIRIWRPEGRSYLVSVPRSAVPLAERDLDEESRRRLANLRTSCARTTPDAAACDELAERLQSGRGAPRDESEGSKAAVRARQAFSLGCNAGTATACARAAQLEPDRRRALDLNEKGCVAGDAQSCEQAAVLLGDGQTLAADAGRANGLWSSACRLGSARGCLASAKAKEGKSPVADVSNDYRRGCELGAAEACRRLAQLVPAGEPGSEREVLLSKACDGADAPACAELGETLERAGRIPESAAASGRACTGGVAAACTRLGILLSRASPRDARATTAFRSGCASGEVEACRRLGAILAEPGGNASEAIEAYDRSCQAGDRASCEAGSDVALAATAEGRREKSGDMVRAILTFSNAACKLDSDQYCIRASFLESTREQASEALDCERKDPGACFSTARRLSIFDNRAKWPSAAAFFWRGCHFDHAESCGNLAAMLVNGSVPKDQDGAEKAARKACELGWKSACAPDFLGGHARRQLNR
jgi:hypothetical protein